MTSIASFTLYLTLLLVKTGSIEGFFPRTSKSNARQLLKDSEFDTLDVLPDIKLRKTDFDHGMPWTNSIDPEYTGEPLYMPFRNWQIGFMRANLSNLRQLPVRTKDGQDASFVVNEERKIRMHTAQYSSDEYKLIRMTTVDGGERLQVFTSLFYPDEKYNMPVLGIDLLMFNKRKYLCITDFQAIQDCQELHDVQYEDYMRPIREQYPTLQGKMTKRFYDEAQFFSSQILLGRYEVGKDEPGHAKNPHDLIFRDMLPAVQSYTRTHLDLIKSLDGNLESKQSIRDRHKAYDKYSAARDPAKGLLASHFGTDFAESYVHDILFPLSTH